MKQEFIPYEQALEIKELGFDEPCFGFYDESLYFPNNENQYGTFCNQKLDTSSCSAPLYQQAFRWFRKNHNLKSWVEEHTKDTFIYEIRPHKSSDYAVGDIYVYKTYEETELACLKKLIEIVKQHKQ